MKRAGRGFLTLVSKGSLANPWIQEFLNIVSIQTLAFEWKQYYPMHDCLCSMKCDLNSALQSKLFLSNCRINMNTMYILTFTLF